MVTPAVICRNLTKIFRQPFSRLEIKALHDVSFHVDQGEFICILGRNGSGKTTLLRMIAGIARPSTGEIHVFGQNPLTYRSRRQIGYMPEKPQFYPEVNANNFLKYMARLRRIKRPKEQVMQIIDLVGLKKWSQVQVNTYSVGMKQRLAFASALIHSPKLLLLDEPLANLDKDGKLTMTNLLTSFIKEDKTIIVATHDPQLSTSANRSIVLE